MNQRRSLPACFAALLLALFLPGAHAQKAQTLFDGKTLDGWSGEDGFWTVKDGLIVGQTTKEKPTGGTFLIWQGGTVADFEFSCDVQFEGNNSGVMYRSQLIGGKGHNLSGYQADLHPKHEFFGMLYGQSYEKRGIIATRGQQLTVTKDGKKNVTGKVGDDAKLDGTQWNTLRIVAVGNRLIHQINGVTTIDLTDNHPKAMTKGLLGLQLHGGAPMTVKAKNLTLRPLTGDAAKAALKKALAAKAPAKKPTAKPKAPDAGSAAWVTTGEKPTWIWHHAMRNNDTIVLRKSFQVPANLKRAKLWTTCDNGAEVFLNGKSAATVPDWYYAQHVDVTKHLKPGANELAVDARNAGGVAAFVLALDLETADGKHTRLLSDNTWLATTAKQKDGWKTAPVNADTKGWKAVKDLGKLGIQPWGVPKVSKPGTGARATRIAKAKSSPIPAADIDLADGFTADLLYTVPKAEQGSWVCICVDPKGRFYTSDQGKQGLYRVTVGATADDTTVEKIDLDLSAAQGLLWAFDSLWFHRSGDFLYRVTDTDGDDHLDTIEKMPSTRGTGEHGNHAVVPTADGKGLYIIAGNYTALPPAESITRQRVQSWAEDLLLPRMWDARGHARGRLAPGGWITRFDPETKTHDLISMGYRNPYDIALNPAGDLFTYDADMEWDLGTPWYRPTRINHAVSGSDFGWRSGTGKYPTYYEDSLPAVVDIGPGSPTGVVSGKDAKFPAKYQRAIYALDWTFGTIWAIHLTPDGASYTGTKERWLAGKPLPVTDATIGADGHFYFLIGGRGGQSALYRVRYTGGESTLRAPAPKPTAAATLRRSLEKFHGVSKPDALDAAWPHLASPDRFIRNAARVAIESQPSDTWSARVHTETRPQARITAAVALARSGAEADKSPLLKTLLDMPLADLPKAQQLGWMRALALTFTRLGKPSDAERTTLIERLDPMLPADSKHLNTELVRLLSYLDAPTVTAKTMALIANRSPGEAPDWADLISGNDRYGQAVRGLMNNPPPSQEVGYALMLRSVQKGWDLEGYKQYFGFINDASKRSGGASYPGFLTNIRKEALANVSGPDTLALQDLTGTQLVRQPDFPINPPKGPGRDWTLDEAVAAADRPAANFNRGRSLYFATSCGACHRMDGLGGGIGPDLTSVPSKFDLPYIVEAIINPSKDISDQYSSSILTTTDGKTLNGIAIERDDKILLYPPHIDGKPTELAKAKVASIKPSPVSQMPPALINSLNADELRDLIAYIMSGANKSDRRFKR